MNGDLFGDIKAADGLPPKASITVTGVLVGLLIGKAWEFYRFHKFAQDLI